MNFRSVWITPLLLVCLVHGQNNPNIANASSVASSDEAIDQPAKQAVDGSLDTDWESSGSPENPAWIILSWKHAVAVRELVIHRWKSRRGAPDLTHLKAEIFEAGAWHDLSDIGDGKTPLPETIYQRVPAHTITKLRLSGLDAKARITEIEMYSKITPGWIDVRGDARGNIIGEVTDGFGANGLKAEVQASGRAGGQPWRATAMPGDLGDFTIPMPVGLAGAVEFTAVAGGETIRKAVDAGDLQEGLVPTPAPDTTVELDGKWRFMPDPPAGFEQAKFEDSSWSEIDVPAHWVMQGFQAEKGQGGYRRHVQIPSAWRGQRMRIAFDGVYSGAEVWWNGRRVGSHMGGATPFQLDVTEAASPGADNVVAVRVSQETQASKMDHMSMYADFPLAGIFRRARIFAVPLVHVQREQSHAEFDSEHKSADLVTEVSVANESGAALSGATLSFELMQGGNAIAKSDPFAMDLPAWSKAERTVKLHVDSPLPWSAEHPNLYTLETVISRDGSAVERISKKVGFRDTRIDKTTLLINGVAIKLKGTAHHDSDPLLGRAVTPAIERQDVELMKEANIDSLRTSHYIPIPELDDIADELGLYLEEEAPFCWVGDAYDLRWGAFTRQIAAEMVERDMSHPSVAYWSGGNESDWGPTLDLDVREIRAHDPSRPVMGSWTNNVDFTIRHNPMSVAGIQSMEKNDKPILWDESIAIFQGIWGQGDGAALWRDPGLRDYYVAPLVDVMDAFWKSKVVQASFIWAWSDDMFLVPGRGSEYGRGYDEGHGVDRIYHQDGKGLVGDAPWGVIDGWRRRKPEFWHIKNLYSPIKVKVRELPLPASGRLQIPVDNQYFFTNLSELAVKWQLGEQSGSVQADIAPQSSGTLEIPVTMPIQPGSELQLRFMRGENLINVFAVGIGKAPANPRSTRNAPALRRHDQELLSGITPRIDGEGFSAGISSERGLLAYLVADNAVTLYDQPQIHILPIRGALQSFPYARNWTLDRPVDIAENDGSITVTTRGHYPNLVGTYTTTLSPGGDLTISYDFQYDGPEMRAIEVGFEFGVPVWMDRLSWKRIGEWTWYPQDHIGALSGEVSAHSGRPPFVIPTWSYSEDDSPMGSNDFRSTKRNITEASVKDSAGHGWKIHSNGSQHLRVSVESDRVAIYVNDWYGGSTAPLGEYGANYDEGKVLHSGQRIHSTLHLSVMRGPAGRNGDSSGAAKGQ
jgi:hypothetical protein